MTRSLNRVQLIGNVGKDPEIRRSQAGKPIANFSVATSETWKDSHGEKQEKTHWHNCVCFNDGLCGVIERYVQKGSKIFIEGQLQTRRWQDQSGQDRYSTEVVLSAYNGQIILLDGKGSGDRQEARQESNTGRETASSSGGVPSFSDDIPFAAEIR